ncbi:MAG: alpha-L-fucosidase, partial [Planctomycetes bacterium]|nr:alpha-L-fucosidase [Planctomycetota bacterium]
ELDLPLAGIWLDIISAYYRLPHLIPVQETYRLIRELRPEALISYKTGATGTEDFASPERSFSSASRSLREQGLEAAAQIADKAWAGNQGKHNEICMTLQRKAWAYKKDSEHLQADEVRGLLADAIANNCNLLSNVGPLPDGSIHPEDVATLRAVGESIRARGWPTAEEVLKPEPEGTGKAGKLDAAAV